MQTALSLEAHLELLIKTAKVQIRCFNFKDFFVVAVIKFLYINLAVNQFLFTLYLQMHFVIADHVPAPEMPSPDISHIAHAECENYLREVHQFVQNSDITERVHEWEKSVKPFLDEMVC